ncbi:uncharacterized protein A4U43_C05F32970 [Asparagus officinalis]|uniref:AIG1-type G domain-containing protein n=1 Tax=Asparagus officinalis TaxID=4686 RepID=A0A5P1EWA4_ASPOF|nr:translocase of chloroplast 90, chloroplastic-like [Asparagus officinalis]ONK70365.1 uncharacterized protein A4U43_C05F32970 [Asparagus officinalis]
MKNLKEWFSYELLSKSLLSARPFSFFYEESLDGELGNRGTTVTRMSETSTTAHYRDTQQNILRPEPIATEGSDLAQYINIDSNTDTLTRLEALQINFLRLIHRIGQSPANPVASQVLYRLQLASLIRAGETNVKRPALKLDRARVIASKLEADGQSDLDFSFKILILGKTGVGKSATINSIFDQSMAPTDAFQPATHQIQEVTGTIKGIKVTVIDTPGLSSFLHNQRENRKILFQVKKLIRRSPPDVVLYLDRLDTVKRGDSDCRLLKLITDVFGASIWCNAIIGMTHCSSSPPEGPDGYTVSYESYIDYCTNLLQHYIHQAIESTQLQNPTLLIENHPMCQKNAKGEKILPNGQVWMSQLLLLCTATKVLGDANNILRFQDSFQVTKKKTRLPSLPHLLSSLLHPRNSLEDEPGELFNDIEDDEYDQLPLIRILTKSQYKKLSKEQRKAYLDELEYRETLYLKKQWNDEIRRRKENNCDDYEDDASQELVQLPDIALPLNFDPDCPAHRYRCLMSTDNQWLIRPVLNSQGWDHDIGFDGINLETTQDLKQNLKASFMGQINKDKEEFNIQSQCATQYSDQKGRSIITAIDIQSTDDNLVCTIHGDAKFKNLGCNSSGGGLTLTSFAKSCFIGGKIEDSVSIGRRFKLVLNAGRVVGNGQVANGGSLEATMRGRDYPVRDEKVKLSASVLSFDKEVVFGGSLETDFRVNPSGKMSVNANLNSRSLGQVCLKFNTSEHTEIGLIAVVSLLQTLFCRRRSSDAS